jgi:hypothetical protein
LDDEKERGPAVLLLDECGTDGGLLLFHVRVALSDALVAEDRHSTRVQWARLNRRTDLPRGHFEPDGNAYVGVGSAARGDNAPREKSWEPAGQGAGRR